jgi:two-component system response regulator DevR
MYDQDEPTIGVVIIDDHRMFCDGLVRLLDEEEGIEVLGVATIGAEGVELAARTRPRVALVDYQMPEQDGIAIAVQIKRAQPETMVLMLTASTEDRVLLAAIDAGCSGFLTKDRAAAEVVAAVRAAAAGEALISPAMLARLLPKLSRTHRTVGSDVTERERELLGFLAQGWTNRVIADEMHLSVNTVRNYVQAVLTKLGAHSKLEAVATAVREGIISYPQGR